MSESIFSQERFQALDLARAYIETWQQCVKDLAEIRPTIAQTAQEYEPKLQKAFDDMVKGLEKPILRLAATGTTSSAKSSLLNFLCGVKLLPTAVQEKSAGLVRIIHDEVPSLVVSYTENALWECGEFVDINAQDIHNFLNEVMDRYWQAIASGAELAPPVFEIHYPLALAQEASLEDLQLELIDLPGLKYCGDERNRKVIRTCRDALCLLTYNCKEVDPMKQEAILDEVVEQIRAIGGSVSRMLFVATCADEFLLREPYNWPENEDSFIAGRLKAISEKIKAELPEQADCSIEMTRLSPEPALYALQLQQGDDRFMIWKKLKSSYMGLVEGGRNRHANEGLDTDCDLSEPKYTLWTDEDWQKIVEQLYETTGRDVFIEQLNTHISHNLGAIIFPTVCNPFVSAADSAKQWLSQSAEVTRAQIKGELEEQQKRLEALRAQISRINTEAEYILDDFVESIKKVSNDISSANANALAPIVEYMTTRLPGLQKEDLAPLSSWANQIFKACEKPLDAIRDLIVSHKKIPATMPLANELDACCRELYRANYRGNIALYGTDVISNKREFEEIERILQRLFPLCAQSVRESMDLAIMQESDRIHQAFVNLKNAYLKSLAEKCSQLSSDMAVFAGFDSFTLDKVQVDYCLPPIDFIEKIVQREPIKEKQEVNDRPDYGNEVINAIVSLWRKVTGTETVTVEVTYVSNKLPPIRTLLQERLRESSTARKKAIGEIFFRIISEQVAVFKKQVKDYQESVIDSYFNKLNEAKNEKLTDMQQSEEALNTVLRALEDCSGDIQDLKALYKA